jgi:hypothetical protein
VNMLPDILFDPILSVARMERQMGEVIEFPEDKMSARHQEIMFFVHQIKCYPGNQHLTDSEMLARLLPELEAWGAGLPNDPCGHRK